MLSVTYIESKPVDKNRKFAYYQEEKEKELYSTVL